MNRRSIRWLPVAIAGLIVLWQYFGSDTYINPETGRKSRVAMSMKEEEALGFQTYRQVLSQARAVESGPELELVKRVASRLAAATGDGGEGISMGRLAHPR